MSRHQGQYEGLSDADFARHFMPRIAVPDHETWLDQDLAASAAVRERVPHRRNARYGAGPLQLFDLFPAEQVHIVRSEDLYREPNNALAAAFEFLGVPETPPLVPHRFNEIRASQMPAEERARMAEYYAPHVAALEKRLGRDFGWDLVNGGLLSDHARA